MGYHLMPGLGMEEGGRPQEGQAGHLLCLEPTVSGLNLLNPQEPQGSLLVKTERARGLSVLRGLQFLFSFSYIIYLFM